ncbi:hypothetical protein [Paracoccus albus]|uniref:hypothetical protein n=1 Tax=Paracoccus albus TaxID=3017784 RepID=UPI0022F019DC|nr:hypothetical protein [Paracoccus albus]WBU61380.1 hypothetical protein PAF20_05630 [Paracoccus albus]
MTISPEEKTLASIQQMSKTQLAMALAIMSTQIDECDVSFEAGSVVVRGQRLNPLIDEDRAVLAILIADKEFGFSVSTVEKLASELRDLQNVWFDAANQLKLGAAA